MKYFLLVFLIINQSYAQKLDEEKELEVIDFSKVKDLLKKDGLEKEALNRKKEIEIIKEERKKIDAKKFIYPNPDDFWSFISEYWLVKNATWLKWDIQNPDYGLVYSIKELLLNLGMLNTKFKLLIVDNPQISHLGIPASSDDHIILLSLPFMRTLDLSKLEISLLVLEDILRIDEEYFKKEVETDKMKNILGTSFEGKSVDHSWMEEVLKNYQTFITQKGFSFNQQFHLTKKMDALLKPKPELWNAYIKLLNKIDRLVKNDKLYDLYLRLYPSPEMQIKWMSPEEKSL